MPAKAIIFDRDNTLLHLERTRVAQFEQRVHAIAGQLPPGAAVRHWMSWDGGWPRTPADEDRFWQQFWAKLGEQYGLNTYQVEQLQGLGAFYHTVFVAYEDTVPCLAQLRANGMRLAILTNFDLPSVDRTLSYAGVDPTWFDVLCSSAEIGARKPDHAAYLTVAQRLELEPSDCIFVDDLIENVQAAQQLGMQSILIDRQNKHANYHGKSLQNLYNILTLI